MKSIALAVSFAGLAGCAVVPVGPPVYVGATVNAGPRYAQPYPYYRPYPGPYNGSYHGPYYGPRWRGY